MRARASTRVARRAASARGGDPGVEGRRLVPHGHEQPHHEHRLHDDREGVLHGCGRGDRPTEGAESGHQVGHEAHEVVGHRGDEPPGHGHHDRRDADARPQPRRAVAARHEWTGPGQRPRPQADRDGRREEDRGDPHAAERPGEDRQQQTGHEEGGHDGHQPGRPQRGDLPERQQDGRQTCPHAREGDDPLDPVPEPGPCHLGDGHGVEGRHTGAPVQSTSPSWSWAPSGHTALTMPAAANALRQPGHGGSVM